ncbi:hypothetical protein Tco_0919582 [Tanacetum coccineum]
MHNNIMVAGSRDRPPMLATGRYAQWRSRFLWYIDTKTNGDALRKCILEEKEAIHDVSLTGIGDEIYSTVDACNTAHEMWEAIERLQQEWSRFVTIVKQQHKLDEVSYHKFFDILKQYQKEVNELRAERIAKNANPLALVATAQPYQDPYYQTSKTLTKPSTCKPTSNASLPTISHATTRHKDKEIAKPITPPSESASEEDSNPEQHKKDKEMQKNLALIAKYFKKIYKPSNNTLRTSSNTRNKNVDTTPRYKNDNQCRQFGNQRTMTIAGAKETVGWLVYTDEEIDEQELEAHYIYMAKIQEVPNADSGTNSEPLEHVQYDTDINEFSCNEYNIMSYSSTTTNFLSLSNSSMYYEFREAFHRLFSADVGTFKDVLSRNMQSLQRQLNKETLHEKDSNSGISMIKVQFDNFIHSRVLELSNYNLHALEITPDFKAYTNMEAQTFKETIIQNMDSIEQCIIERARHEQELQNRLKRLNERKLQIQECKIQEVKASNACSGDTDSSGIVSDKGNDQSLENHSSTYGDETSRSRNECNDKVK